MNEARGLFGVRLTAGLCLWRRSRETGIRILILQLSEYFIAYLLNNLRGNYSWRDMRDYAIKQSLKDADAPFAINQTVRDIDSTDGYGHGLSLFGVYSGISCSCPGFRLIFVDVRREQRCENANSETEQIGEYEVANSKIPTRLEFWTPSDVVTMRTLNNGSE